MMTPAASSAQAMTRCARRARSDVRITQQTYPTHPMTSSSSMRSRVRAASCKVAHALLRPVADHPTSE